MDIASWLQSIVLGVVQGLTEFIPVSSSGHLVLVPYLLAWERPGLAFDVALHLGTVGAILAYFREELAAMGRGIIQGGRTAEGRIYRRLVALLAVGTVPVAVAGALLTDFFAEVFETPPAAALFLFVTAGLLVTAEAVRGKRVRRSEEAARATRDQRAPVWAGSWIGTAPADDERAYLDLPVGDDAEDPEGRTLADVGIRDAVLIGVFQIAALFPGISRSGVTITAGMLGGLTREAATRFSFLLALPALLGAAIVTLPDLREPGAFPALDVLLGILAALVSGYVAIRFLIAFVSRDRLTVFAKYCVIAGVIGLAAWYMIG